MKYIVIIHKEPESCYGITIPDFPGCISACDCLEDVQKNVQEAIEVHLEGENVTPPVPMKYDDAVKLDAYKDGGMLMAVDVSFDFLDKTVIPVNVSMPRYMRDYIDKAAQKMGLTRSAYIVQAAQAYSAL